MQRPRFYRDSARQSPLQRPVFITLMCTLRRGCPVCSRYDEVYQREVCGTRNDVILPTVATATYLVCLTFQAVSSATFVNRCHATGRYVFAWTIAYFDNSQVTTLLATPILLPQCAMNAYQRNRFPAASTDCASTKPLPFPSTFPVLLRRGL